MSLARRGAGRPDSLPAPRQRTDHGKLSADRLTRRLCLRPELNGQPTDYRYGGQSISPMAGKLCRGLPALSFLEVN